MDQKKTSSIILDSDSMKHSMPYSENKNLSDDELKIQLNLFDTIITRSYLTRLTEFPIVTNQQEELSNMGWYKITKVVLDEESFFPDQLSMLYTALHNVAKNVALIIEKKGFDDIEIYIGARDFSGNYHNASSLLASSIQGYLPGVKTEKNNNKVFSTERKSTSKYVASYSGIASLRDDKKEDFIQGIEKFIDATPSIPSFTAVFIADNISQTQASSMIKAFSSIEDAFSPLMQCQETVNQSETEGVSSTLTDTIGETLTESLSETVTRSEGTNTSYSSSIGTGESRGSNMNPNIGRTIISSIFGGESGTNTSSNTSKQESKQDGNHTDYSKADQRGESNAINKNTSTADGTNSSITSGKSWQITRSNSQAKRYVDIIDRHIERLQNGIPFGLWSIGSYFVSPDDSTSLKLANIYRGCVAGEKSDIEANAVNVWNEADSALLFEYIKDTQNPRFRVGDIDVSAGVVVTSKELAIHMSLPQKSIPGVEVRECATFGRNLNGKRKINSADLLSIGYISHLGNISQKEVLLDIEELNKHVFVTGSTGSGKSNTIYLLIKNILNKGKKVLVIEPTKGDYRKVFGGRKDFSVYGTRPDEKNLLRINPFQFPENIRVEEHVERLIEIFNVCWPMYAAMPAVLKDSILAAYESCGWNIKNSTCRHSKLFPTIEDVIIQLKRIIRSSEYSADTKGDYIGALQTRLQSLTNGIYSSILSSTNAVSYEDLYDKNAIIDLHRIGSSETRSLIMGLLVLGLSEWRMSQGEDVMDQSLQHTTILEEAHCILPRVSKQQSQEGSNVLGKSVEMIAAAIAEMRTYGESFIIVDQSPSMIDEAAIRNTNTKIIMNLPDGDDREIAGKSIGLSKEAQFEELARLATGEAIVWQRGWSEAVLTEINEMTEKSPLLKKDNTIDSNDSYTNIPSNLFIRFFIHESELSKNDREELCSEILSSDCNSCAKSILLDKLISNKIINNTILRDTILEYLKLIKSTRSILDKFEYGCADIIWELREDMASRLSIIDSETQNKLLSLSFIWASKQCSKWHKLCSQSMPFSSENLKTT